MNISADSLLDNNDLAKNNINKTNSTFLTYISQKSLNLSIRSWFTVALIGQWLFVSYIIGFYWITSLSGDLQAWNQVLPHGHVEGETLGNAAVVIHILLSTIIMFGGPLQFIPWIRKTAPKFHRWNGRIYLTTAIVTSLTGLFMVITRGTIGGTVGNISISINALLILLFAYFAWQFALKRNFSSHRRWAIRLFVVVSGVWFFRVGLMAWIIINGSPVGIDFETFSGPFLTFLNFAQYLLPLAIVELYFAAQSSPKTSVKISVAILLIICALITAAGIFAAFMGMWLPRIVG